MESDPDILADNDQGKAGPMQGQSEGKGNRKGAELEHKKGHPVKGAPLGCGCLVFAKEERQH